MCAVGAPDLKHFTTDCYPALNSDAGPEVECRCCTQCCNDEDENCNDHDWPTSHDLKAEYGYIRQSYEFSLDENALKEDWRDEVMQEALAGREEASVPP